jgi:hypothetical protein
MTGSEDRAIARLRSGLYVPLLDELSDPALVARLAPAPKLPSLPLRATTGSAREAGHPLCGR